MPEVPAPEPGRATVRELARKIKGEGPTPRFCFFLGAGASIQSGISLASEMKAHFCQSIMQEQCPEDCTDPKEQQAWLEQQQWYKDASSNGTLYSVLFEMYEKKAAGRQRYIEQIIEGREPSFGYVVLAHLMANNYVSTVVTTNFDDLIYKACSTFTDIRPVVYAYGNMIYDLRITNPRPKILKLHGDYLYSKLRNSSSELARQDPNMSRHVSMLLNEYGLVVIGYSGCDNSVMQMLRKFPPHNDFYWCGRADSPLPDSVRSLLSETGGSYVEIDSFDQMMNEIGSVVGFDVPKLLGSLEARQDQMIEQLKRSPPNLSAYRTLLREICDWRLKDADAVKQKSRKDQALLHYANALNAWQDTRDLGHAEAEFRASLELNPDDINAHISLAGVLCQQGRYAESEEELRKVPPTATGEDLVNVHYELAYQYLVQWRLPEALAEFTEVIRLSPRHAAAYNGAGVAYLWLKRLDEAIAALRSAAELDPASYYPAFNLASALALKGDQAESQEWWLKARSLWRDNDLVDPYNHAIVEACLGHTAEAVQQMRAAVERGQPGVARLALEAVLLLESGPAPPLGIQSLREMLEKAAAPQTTPEAAPKAG